MSSASNSLPPPFDVAAPILPNVGLGGLVLRTRLVDIADQVMRIEYFRRPELAVLVPPFEVRYTFGNGEIEVGVDARNGKIFKLIACAGYQGLLFDKIRVGMPVREAYDLAPGLYYNEAEEGIFARK